MKRARTIRIAASTTCAVACVALIALWVRSYGWFDAYIGPLWGSYGLSGVSEPGMVGISVLDFNPPLRHWRINSTSVEQVLATVPPGAEFMSGFGLVQGGAHMPYWFLVLLTAALAALTWIPLRWLRQFSLRTLLIVITLVAVVLGIAATFH